MSEIVSEFQKLFDLPVNGTVDKATWYRISYLYASVKKLSELKVGLKSVSGFSVDSIGDIAAVMSNRKKLRQLRIVTVLICLPLTILQWSSIILWITKEIRWLFPVWVIVSVPYAVLFSRWYFRKMAYICPQCHTVFRPTVKEGLWARHTAAARRLTCPSCGHHGFCVEIAAESEVKDNA